MDPFVIEEYFVLLRNTLDELKLQDTPEQIWNLDVTNFSLDPSKTKLVGKKRVSSSRTTAGSGRDNTTVLIAVNSAGHKPPPLIVFKGRNIWNEWVAPQNESFPGTTYAATSKWLDGI